MAGSRSIFETIQRNAESLKIGLDATFMASFAQAENLSQEQLIAISKLFAALSAQVDVKAIETLLRLGRLPTANPKTFKDFDFKRLRGNVNELRNLENLTQVYAKRNIALIGRSGVGKTHLAMALGNMCCRMRWKSYFLKANELRYRLTDSWRAGKSKALLNSLVKPTCLIIDDIGKCRFDKESTRMFAELIDRRYCKEKANTTVFTSNSMPNTWIECFDDTEALQSALDRIFDRADIFVMDGESYRGRKTAVYNITAG